MTENVNRPEETKVLFRAENPDRAILLAVILSLGCWDFLPIDVRQAWCERGEILDTPGGRLLAASIEAAGGFT